MKATKIAENVYDVGAIDYKLRMFHGYSTEKGSSYNAFLIVDDQITLIDTVKESLFEDMLERIASVVDPAKIQNIICNHVEPDHSGSLKKILQHAPNAVVYASSMSGGTGLKKYYGNDIDVKPLKTGDTLTIGKTVLSFIQSPMVHWPDNMFTLDAARGILFSNDAFGQHYASDRRFDTEVDLDEVLHQARKYYANIVMPYTGQVERAFALTLDKNIKLIAPSHGILWAEHIPDILALYNEFILNKPKKHATIVYDTMWHSTEKMAYAIGDAFNECGIDVTYGDLQTNHISDLITHVSKYEYLVVGSPTLNNGILPSVAAFLCYVKGLSPKNRKFFSFGSYGWGGQSPKIIHENLLSCGLTPLCDPYGIQFLPTKEELLKLKEAVKTAIMQ